LASRTKAPVVRITFKVSNVINDFKIRERLYRIKEFFYVEYICENISFL